MFYVSAIAFIIFHSYDAVFHGHELKTSIEVSNSREWPLEWASRGGEMRWWCIQTQKTLIQINCATIESSRWEGIWNLEQKKKRNYQGA